MARERLTEVVPVRLSRRDKIALRRLARESNVDVSDVVRDLIAERLRRVEDDAAIDAGESEAA